MITRSTGVHLVRKWLLEASILVEACSSVHRHDGTTNHIVTIKRDHEQESSVRAKLTAGQGMRAKVREEVKGRGTKKIGRGRMRSTVGKRTVGDGEDKEPAITVCTNEQGPLEPQSRRDHAFFQNEGLGHIESTSG